MKKREELTPETIMETGKQLRELAGMIAKR